jgi:hypothetical protein
MQCNTDCNPRPRPVDCASPSGRRDSGWRSASAMTAKEYPRRKSSIVFSGRARECTHWGCCVDGCEHCSVARFGSRWVVRSDRVQRSPCAFPCENGSEVAQNRQKLPPRTCANWRRTEISMDRIRPTSWLVLANRVARNSWRKRMKHTIGFKTVTSQ